MPANRPYLKEASGIKIKKLIVHIIDPPRQDKKESRGFVPSEAEIQMEGRADLQRFFTNHINSSLSNPSNRVAKFKKIEEGASSGFCAGMLGGGIDFVTGSTGIAKLLYGIMKDGRTKEADLVVAVWEAENFPGKQFLALLKVDPAEALQHRIIEEEGKKVIDYTVLANAFTNQKLQKCAFIQAVTPERHPDYDMVLLDLKTKDVAKYFQDKLLDAVDSFTARERTEKLSLSFTEAANYIRDTYGEKELDAFETQRKAAMGWERINYEELTEALPLPAEGKSKLLEIFGARLADKDFEIDPEYAGNIDKKRIFRGENGLRVEVQSLYSNQVIRPGKEIMEDGKVVGREITIAARGWHEVTK